MLSSYWSGYIFGAFWGFFLVPVLGGIIYLICKVFTKKK